MIAAIPSPHSNVIHLGPVAIHLYGVTLLVAIAACVWLTKRRWEDLGGEFDLVVRVTVWGVAAGIVGARLYHDVTSWNEVPTPKWQGVFEIWKGGLGVWGGILFGTLAGVWVIRRSGESARLFMDAVAPGILLAQGIGRIGNYFNQELYGKVTKLPWGLEIDQSHFVNPNQTLYVNGHRVLFHPTFLYELIWDLVGVLILLRLSKRRQFRPPALFALYVAYYCFGRFFEELLRIDPAHHIFGLRLNAWVSAILFVAASWFFIRWQVQGKGWDPPPPPKRKPKPRPIPEGPRMDIPRSRVR